VYEFGFDDKDWPIVTVTARGVGTVEDTEEYIARWEEWLDRAEASGRPFAVEMISLHDEQPRQNREARKLNTRWHKENREHVAGCCAGIATVVKSSRLLALFQTIAAGYVKRTMGCPGSIFASRDEARTWLDERLRDARVRVHQQEVLRGSEERRVIGTGRTTGAQNPRPARHISRRRLLSIGGASLAGVMALGVVGCGGRAGEAGGAASAIRVEHEEGEARIEAPARRVVAISDEALDLLVALGVEPVGLASMRIQGSVGQRIGGSPYYVDIGDPVFLGSAESPSVERAAALDPDLIVMSRYGSNDLYRQLSQAAPTLSYSVSAPGWWRGPLVDVGRATGTEGRGRRFVAEYDALVVRLRKQVAPLVEESPRLAVLYAPDASATFVFDERGAPADPHAKLGFRLVVPDGLKVPPNGFAQVSPEVISDLRADTIVVLRVAREGQKLDRLPLDGILDALEGPDGPRVLRQVIDPTRPSSSPVADRQAIEQAAELLLEGRQA
jgi:iron complex transport system substrate-binding protein